MYHKLMAISSSSWGAKKQEPAQQTRRKKGAPSLCSSPQSRHFSFRCSPARFSLSRGFPCSLFRIISSRTGADISSRTVSKVTLKRAAKAITLSRSSLSPSFSTPLSLSLSPLSPPALSLSLSPLSLPPISLSLSLSLSLFPLTHPSPPPHRLLRSLHPLRPPLPPPRTPGRTRRTSRT